MQKRIYYWGICVYGLYLLLALLFYKERTILLDNSFFLFEMARTGSFITPHYRFIAAIPQVPAVIGLKMQLPLNIIMILFSAGYATFHAFCYLLAGSVFKNYRLAIAQLLAHFLILNYTFYWHISELGLGISLMFPLLAVMVPAEQLQMRTGVRMALVVLLALFLPFSHPVIVFPFVFAIAWFIAMRGGLPLSRTIVVTALAAFIPAFACKKLFFTDEYEAASSGSINNIRTLFPHYFDLYSNRHFIENWFSTYYWLPVMLIVAVVVLVVRRGMLPAGLLFAAVIGYTALINISYPTSYTQDFYMENLYQPLSFFLAIAFVSVFAGDVKPVFFALIFVLVAATAFARIICTKGLYQKRLAYLQSQVELYRGRKVLLQANEEHRQHLQMVWASPYEVWLLSTAKENKTAAITIAEDAQAIEWICHECRGFAPTWGMYKYNELNPTYFRFTDSTSDYRLLFP